MLCLANDRLLVASYARCNEGGASRLSELRGDPINLGGWIDLRPRYLIIWVSRFIPYFSFTNLYNEGFLRGEGEKKTESKFMLQDRSQKSLGKGPMDDLQWALLLVLHWL